MEYNYFYKITNIVNNKFYYGVHKTNNLNDSYLGSGVALKRAHKKYGKENFTREILKLFDTYEECLAHEALIVDEDMVKDPMCYNMKTGGIGGVPSEEIIAKITASNKGVIRSDEYRAKMSASHKGLVASEETKAKMSASRKGVIRSDEYRAKMSASHKGIKLSEETKIKRRLDMKSRITQSSA